MKNINKWIKLFSVIAFLMLIFFALKQYVSIEFLQQNQEFLNNYYNNHKVLSVFLYILIFVIVSTLGLPAPYVFTLFAGYMFGFWYGLIWSLIAYTIHCLVNFLLARHLFREFVQSRFKETLKPINKGLEESGVFYLIFLRVSLITPTFWVNCACGITYMNIITYIIITFISTLPLLYIFASSGELLGEITTYMDLYDVKNLILYISSILISLALLRINQVNKKNNIDTSAI
ncbi:MAG: hypothetical protein CMP39_03335 [Rickettsiales bacterium]|nr:hypothetical protein [Rickettsiales bacterium]|tara:strand:- start:454 stop:1149 length:696 start_codon:yes stop_codon:yes gene_type:complete